MSARERFDSITGDDLYRKLAMGESIVLLDVRTEAEFERKHIPGSLLIPLQSLPARVADVPNSGIPVAVICEQGIRAVSACRLLVQYGYGPLSVLTDGLSGWPGPTIAGSGSNGCPADRLSPSSYLVEHFSLLRKGLALDLAMGKGRNAIYLATRGFDVDGVDANPRNVAYARVAARSLNAPIRAVVGNVEDGSYIIPLETYDSIVVFNYLHRPLFTDIRDGLVPGGVVMYQTYTEAQAALGRPTNPDYLLQPGELKRVFDDWEILAYREFTGPTRIDGPDRAVASIVARKP